MSARFDKDALREVRPLVALGVPTALTQLGYMMLGVVDTMMVGRLGVTELGAASLGNLWIFGTLILGMGLMFGLDPIIAQAHGARDHERVGLTLQQGVVAALIASGPIALLWLLTEPVLLLFGQDPQLAAGAHGYVITQIPSIPVFLVFLAVRQYLQGRGMVMPAFWITVLANGVNALGNWVLIFGHLGFPALGLIGAAVATAVTRGFMLVALVALVLALKLHKDAWVPWSRRALDGRDLGRIFKLGIPVGVQYALEGWAFQIATLFAGLMSKNALAAHTIVLNMASLAFMMPVGISMGAAAHVGNLIGAEQLARAQRAAHVALGLGGLVMILSAGFFVGLRWVLPGLYTDDAAVIALAASILPIGAAFQTFDGVQAVGGGIVRGMGNTLPAAVINLVGYALALSLGAWLGFETSLGLTGIWWGLAAGLAVVATAMVAWVVRRGPARVTSRVVSTASGASTAGDGAVENEPPGAA